MKRLYLILAVAAGIGLLAGVQASHAAENAISVRCDPCRADQEITVTYTMGSDRASLGSTVLMRVSHEGAETHLEKVMLGHSGGVFAHTF